MSKIQYTVKVRVPQDELAELVGWVAAMNGAVLLSSDLIANRGSDKKTNGSSIDNTDPRLGRKNNIDPRLVFEGNPHLASFRKLDIEASLAKLGLDAEYLRKTKTKAGTAEHSIKMAMASRERKAEQA